jgi:hypothetical protein
MTISTVWTPLFASDPGGGAGDFVRTDGTLPLTASWDAGNHTIFTKGITARAASDLAITGVATKDIIAKTGATDDTSQFIIKDSADNDRFVIDGSDYALMYPRVYVKELNLKGALLGFTGDQATRIVFRTNEDTYTEGGADITRKAGLNGNYQFTQRGTGNITWIKPEGGGDFIYNQTRTSTGFIIRTLGNANTFDVDGANDRVGIKRTPTTHDFEVNGDLAATGIHTYSNDLVFYAGPIYDIITKLGDTGGNSNFAVTDSNNNTIFSVNSNGNTIAANNMLVQGLITHIGILDTGNRSSEIRMYSDNTYNPSFNIINQAGANGGLLIDLRGTGDYQWRRLEGGKFVFNMTGTDSDFQIKGDTDDNNFYSDAGADRIGIGTNTPAKKLDVNGDISLEAGSGTYYSNDGTAGLASFSGAVTNITVKNGLITAAS